MESSRDLRAAIHVQRAIVISLIGSDKPVWRVNEEIEYLRKLEKQYREAVDNEAYIAEVNK